MKRQLLIKLGIVAAVILASLVLAIPPREKIHLGLDLQGGMHLVLEVQVDEAVKGALDRTAEAVHRDLRVKGLPVTRVERRDLEGLRLVFATPPEADAVAEVVRNYPSSGLRQVSPTVWEFNFPAAELRQIRTSAVDQALEKIRNRIDAFGVSEPSISKQGSQRLVVQLPGLKNPQRAIELIGRTARLEFKLVHSRAPSPDAPPPPGTERLYLKVKDPETGQLVVRDTYFVYRRTLLTGDLLADARALPDQSNFGQYYVLMRLNSRGRRIFARITEENVGKALAIILDGVIFSAPVIQEPIPGGEARITGSFTPEEARDLAIILREGALPAPVRIVENRTVGPSLGSDSIAQGMRAVLLGGALVVLFMLVYYRLSGLLADCALALNLLIIMGVLALPNLGATLTLPGIAGILLTVGMAVDANVLIFERIREELRLGKTVRAAVEAGFQKATATILDANVTTLIAAVVLFQFGSGPVKGFAVTLAIGIAASMFTAIFVSKTIYETIFSLRRVTRLSI
ncbi:MAG: protein translocase subunit SecD [Candidatus Tectimicrobiota bacterium]|nr:MAG: protein translocase subunit SecD [Candidatus Tectomicrobia bacterium]